MNRQKSIYLLLFGFLVQALLQSNLLALSKNEKTLAVNTKDVKYAAVASAHPLATAAGEKILQAGGNAFDVAVAVSATLAVVEPYSSGLGGGGFWLLYRKSDNKMLMLDGREKAPGQAHRSLYLDKQGNVVPAMSINGPLSAGIPGEPAALVHLAEKYGKLPLSVSLQPAINAALHGFKVDKIYIRLANFRLKALQSSRDAAAIFLKNNKVPALGSLIIQKDLANTLKAIGAQGHAGFYQGPVAQALVDSVRESGGIWTLSDLRNYKVVERPVVKFTFNDLQIYSAAPPSSGGVAIAQILNILELMQLAKLSKVNQIHFTIEAMRRAYRDRSLYLGDPDFTHVPVDKLISKPYAQLLSRSIKSQQATSSKDLQPANHAIENKAMHTTHFSVIDFEGNRVAATLSINYPFGSGFVAKSTGILLNDEMDDFSSKPGVPNVYGLIGGQANAIEPGKRPLSSMSPTFVETKDKVLITGTPGGSRIITMVLHSIVSFYQGLNAQQIVSMPRYHHQYLPDVVQYEAQAFTELELKKLSSFGHRFKALTSNYGNMQVIILDKHSGRLDAASDPRGLGKSLIIKQNK